MKRTCLIELNDYHEECLFSQLQFLKNSGHWVCLVVHPRLKSLVVEYQGLYDECHTVEVDSKVFFGKRIVRVLKLSVLIKKKDVSSIIFNTASSKKEIIALTFFFKKKKLFGTIHNLKKLNKSFSQKLISKNLRHYFVLNDSLLVRAQQVKPSHFFESFYPIFFHKYQSHQLKKDPNEKWVVIPGKIELKRRDYLGTLEVMKSINPEKRPKLILLGRLNLDEKNHINLKETIKNKNLEKDVIFFEEFVENSLFHSYIKMSDFIFTPFSGLGMDYFQNRIMGAFNLSFAYSKPLICPAVLKDFEDLTSVGVFYEDMKELKEILSTDCSVTNKIEKKPSKWNFNIQSQKYNAFIDKG